MGGVNAPGITLNSLNDKKYVEIKDATFSSPVIFVGLQLIFRQLVFKHVPKYFKILGSEVYFRHVRDRKTKTIPYKYKNAPEKCYLSAVFKSK